MEISNLDVPLVAEHVRKLAESEPHMVVYCRYFDEETGQAVCIVGQAMALQGITLADIATDGDGALDFNNGQYIATVLGTVGDKHPESTDWLGAVQYKQDAGWDWSSAVAWADVEGNNAP